MREAIEYATTTPAPTKMALTRTGDARGESLPAVSAAANTARYASVRPAST
jgi:hypothetical protein